MTKREREYLLSQRATLNKGILSQLRKGAKWYKKQHLDLFEIPKGVTICIGIDPYNRNRKRK